MTEPQCQEFRRHWFGPDADKPLIASLGRLVSPKRFSLLIEAAGVRLVVSGARHDESFLSLALASANLSVIPGAAGLSVIHSLSYGTPVVVHGNVDVQRPETEAVEEGFNGAIFREGDVLDLVRAIQHVLNVLPRGSFTKARSRYVVGSRHNPVRLREAFDRAVSGNPALDTTEVALEPSYISNKGAVSEVS